MEVPEVVESTLPASAGAAAVSASAPAADPMVPRPFRVERVRRETADTSTLTLAPADGRETEPFLPGQFNMLYLFGAGESAVSISGDPAEGATVLHTIRAVGAVTRGLTRLKRGHTVGVRGPFGSCWPVDEALEHDVVVIAGGIGLAPLRPAVYHLLAHRPRYGRVVLLYGARSPEEILYRRELESWRGRFDLEVMATVDRAGDDWLGHVGVVTTLIQRATFDAQATVAMICGPEIMMRYTLRTLLDRGVAEEHCHLSMERNMKCAVGFCGHCQLGPAFVCKDGPVFDLPRIRPSLIVREL